MEKIAAQMRWESPFETVCALTIVSLCPPLCSQSPFCYQFSLHALSECVRLWEIVSQVYQERAIVMDSSKVVWKCFDGSFYLNGRFMLHYKLERQSINTQE
jgi:hypothetical protein